jgi:hypothetical protein
LKGDISLAMSNIFLSTLFEPVPFRKPLLAGLVTTGIPTGNPSFLFLVTSLSCSLKTQTVDIFPPRWVSEKKRKEERR